MYKLTWMLFALLFLILPVLTVPVPIPEEIEELEKRNTHSGRGTWYYPGLGSCGGTNNNNQLVVAVSEQFPGAGGADCWKHVQINAGGKSVTAQIVDSCPGCGPNDLDMSPATFEHLAPLSRGVVGIQWHVL